MKRTAILVLMLIAGLCCAQNFAQHIRCDVDSASGASLPSKTILQGTTPLWSLDQYRNGQTVNAVADGAVRAVVVVGSTATGGVYAAITNQSTSGAGYLAQFPVVGTNSGGAGANPWWYTVIYQDNAGHTFWTGSGKLTIEPTAWIGVDGLHWTNSATLFPGFHVLSAPSAVALPFAQHIKCEIESADGTSLPDKTILQGSTPIWSIDQYGKDHPLNIATDGSVRAVVVIGPSATNGPFAMVTNQIATGNSFVLQFPTVGTNSGGAACDPWWYAVVFQTTNGKTFWTGSGNLTIEPIGWTGQDGLGWGAGANNYASALAAASKAGSNYSDFAASSALSAAHAFMGATSAMDRAYSDAQAAAVVATAVAQAGAAVPGFVASAIAPSISAWSSTGSVSSAGAATDATARASAAVAATNLTAYINGLHSVSLTNWAAFVALVSQASSNYTDAAKLAITNDPHFRASLTNGSLYATAAQGTNADTAVQPAVLSLYPTYGQSTNVALSVLATSGVLTNPAQFATAAQGAYADGWHAASNAVVTGSAAGATAVQPAALALYTTWDQSTNVALSVLAASGVLTNGALYATAAQGAKADTAVQPATLSGYVAASGGSLADGYEIRTHNVDFLDAMTHTLTWFSAVGGLGAGILGLYDQVNGGSYALLPTAAALTIATTVDTASASNGAVSVATAALGSGLTAGSNYAVTVANAASNGAVSVAAAALGSGLTAGSNYAVTVANAASNGAVSVAAAALGPVLTAGSNYAVTVANAASNGAVSVAAAALSGTSNSLARSYQPWTAILTPPASGGTTLVAFATGTLPLLVCTGAQTVGVNPTNGWGTAGVNRFALALWATNFSVTVQSNSYTRWGTPISLSITRTNHLLFRGTGTNDWTIYQLP